LRIANPT